MPYYTRVLIVFLLLLALAQIIPEMVNTFLVLVIVSMVIMQSGKFAQLIASLKL